MVRWGSPKTATPATANTQLSTACAMARLVAGSRQEQQESPRGSAQGSWGFPHSPMPVGTRRQSDAGVRTGQNKTGAADLAEAAQGCWGTTGGSESHLGSCRPAGSRSWNPLEAGTRFSHRPVLLFHAPMTGAAGKGLGPAPCPAPTQIPPGARSCCGVTS